MSVTASPWTWDLYDFQSPHRAIQLLQCVRKHSERPIVIDLRNTINVYPNGAVAFASTLSHLRTQHDNIELRVTSDSACASISQPLTLDTWQRGGQDTLTHSVWSYRSEEEAQRLANMFMDALTDRVACEEGVIDSINWCLYEVMDNVFQHSHADAGFVMMQLHRERRLCVIAVGDTGIGIQKSLALSRAADIEILRDPGSSINEALQKGVTSKGGENQGNGLFGLKRATEINGGELSIQSGWGLWNLRDGSINFHTDRTFPLIDSANHQSTLVDWRLDCSRKVRIDEALGASHRTSELLETIEDDAGMHRVSVREIEESLGSRKLGADIRTRLENYLSAGAKFVVLDFRGVGVVSSSFADEVLAKLAVKMGELEFRRRVFVDGASTTNRRLVETAIALRLESASTSTET